MTRDDARRYLSLAAAALTDDSERDVDLILALSLLSRTILERQRAERPEASRLGLWTAAYAEHVRRGTKRAARVAAGELLDMKAGR